MTYPEYVERVKELLNNLEWTDLHDLNCPEHAPTACPCCHEIRHWDKPHVVHESYCELDLLRKVVPE